jgi:(2R)-sulfolactate sulfo-lyase subunit alpha
MDPSAISQSLIDPVKSWVLYKTLAGRVVPRCFTQSWEPRTMAAPHLLVHDHKDNCGVVVVENLKAGTDMLAVITHDNSDFRITAKMDIPIGHKVALKDLKKGETVWKYGEDIGIVKADVKKGEHLHVHNAKTKRW